MVGRARSLLASVFLLVPLPASWIVFCVCSNLRAARRHKKLFIRRGTLVTQVTSTHMLMHDARSEACAYLTLERYNNTLTWSIFSVLSPDLIAYLC